MYRQLTNREKAQPSRPAAGLQATKPPAQRPEPPQRVIFRFFKIFAYNLRLTGKGATI